MQTYNGCLIDSPHTPSNDEMITVKHKSKRTFHIRTQYYNQLLPNTTKKVIRRIHSGRKILDV